MIKKCRDCIHYARCNTFELCIDKNLTVSVEKYCKDFKDKTRYVDIEVIIKALKQYARTNRKEDIEK